MKMTLVTYHFEIVIFKAKAALLSETYDLKYILGLCLNNVKSPSSKSNFISLCVHLCGVFVIVVIS